MMKIKYVYMNTNPAMRLRDHNERRIFSLINALALYESIDYQNAYSHYIETLHLSGAGPSDSSIDTKILRWSKYHSHNALTYPFEKGILKHYKSYYYIEIESKSNTLFVFGIRDEDEMKDFSHLISSDRIYIQTDKIRNVGTRSLRKMEEGKNHRVIFNNLNSKGKLVGDCLIRAVANVTGTSWDEAVDGLGQSALSMNRIFLNVPLVFEHYLQKNGFMRYPQVSINNQYLTCDEFCSYASLRFNNEPILLYAGRSHVVALKKKDGNYLIHDTWDSSEKVAGSFYVKTKDTSISGSRKKRSNYRDIRVGYLITHPSFGNGEIMKISDDIVTIQFQNSVRNISKYWVIRNCLFL